MVQYVSSASQPNTTYLSKFRVNHSDGLGKDPSLQALLRRTKITSAAATVRHRLDPDVEQNTRILAGSKHITRRHYPSIVELKIAGRSDQQIAKRFGSNSIKMKSHISRAMNEYRKGELRTNESNTVMEAREVGEEKARKVTSKLGQSVESAGLMSQTVSATSNIAAPTASLPDVSIIV